MRVTCTHGKYLLTSTTYSRRNYAACDYNEVRMACIRMRGYRLKSVMVIDKINVRHVATVHHNQMRATCSHHSIFVDYNNMYLYSKRYIMDVTYASTTDV